jgi:hypothetical protein
MSTNLSGDCAVDGVTPTSPTDMRLDWFDVLTQTNRVYLFKFSPYDGIPPTFQYSSAGGGPPTTLSVIMENCGERTKRRDTTVTITNPSVESTLPRILGLFRMVIRNEDDSYSIIDIDGRQFGNVRQSSSPVYHQHLQPGFLPFGCTVTPLSSTYDSDTLQITTDGGHVYSLVLPSNDKVMSFTQTAGTVGTTTVSLVTYVDM